MSETAEKTIHQSILDRREIHAPAGYVSVFHETTAEALASIDHNGLRVDTESANIGSSSVVAYKNGLLDKDRPAHLADLGVSRTSSIYAYPFLHEGHGLYGADQRFITREQATLNEEFDALRKYGSATLAQMGVGSIDEYSAKMRDPAYLKEQHPGEILELKVDPTKCFVGDLTEVTNAFMDIDRWGYDPGMGQYYWESVISLQDFLQWYKKAEWAEDGNSVKSSDQFRDGDDASPKDYCPLAGAPDGLPATIKQPEILIPDNVPQDHIKVVQ